MVFIESAIAMINLVDICKTCRELSNKGKFIPVALVFGSDDFCASIGATRTEDSTEILYARQKLVLVAKAFGLQAIDMGYIQYKGNTLSSGITHFLELENFKIWRVCENKVSKVLEWVTLGNK